jgi:hypothetical protein
VLVVAIPRPLPRGSDTIRVSWRPLGARHFASAVLALARTGPARAGAEFRPRAVREREVPRCRGSSDPPRVAWQADPLRRARAGRYAGARAGRDNSFHFTAHFTAHFDGNVNGDVCLAGRRYQYAWFDAEGRVSASPLRRQCAGAPADERERDVRVRRRTPEGGRYTVAAIGQPEVTRALQVVLRPKLTLQLGRRAGSDATAAPLASGRDGTLLVSGAWRPRPRPRASASACISEASSADGCPRPMPAQTARAALPSDSASPPAGARWWARCASRCPRIRAGRSPRRSASRSRYSCARSLRRAMDQPQILRRVPPRGLG